MSFRFSFLFNFFLIAHLIKVKWCYDIYVVSQTWYDGQLEFTAIWKPAIWKRNHGFGSRNTEKCSPLLSKSFHAIIYNFQCEICLAIQINSQQMKMNIFCCRQLATTTYWNGIFVDSAAVKRLTKEHPTFIELDMFGSHFTANDVVAVIHQLNSFKTFHFSILYIGRYLDHDSH